MTTIQAAADKVQTDLASYGLAGAILAVLVAPILRILVKATQKRDDARASADKEEATRRAHREDKMLESLVESVANQREAFDAWKAYAAEERQTHAALLASFERLADKITP